MTTVAPPLPLVFFPGAAGRFDALRPLAERLVKRRPAILVEYPGLGGVAGNPEIKDLFDLSRHCLESLPSRFDAVAMSMGGVVVLSAALAAPHRIRKLVLLATSGGVDVATLGAIDWRDTLRRRLPDAPTWFLDDATDLTHELGRVSQSTLLVFGDADLIAPVSIGKFLASRLPNARLEVISDATHDLEVEFPDLIASLIEAHLRKPENAGAEDAQSSK